MLSLSVEQSLLIKCWARSALPLEACGLIIGQVETSSYIASSVVSLRNVEAERPQSRYRMDPSDIFDAGRRALSCSESIIGVWHSHPKDRAEPSQADLGGAWAGQVYLIIGPVCSAKPELRAWCLEESETEFFEIAIELRSESRVSSKKHPCQGEAHNQGKLRDEMR
jgi:proteasome lid subunit RPN8/RPN11